MSVFPPSPIMGSFRTARIAAWSRPEDQLNGSACRGPIRRASSALCWTDRLGPSGLVRLTLVWPTSVGTFRARWCWRRRGTLLRDGWSCRTCS